MAKFAGAAIIMFFMCTPESASAPSGSDLNSTLRVLACDAQPPWTSRSGEGEGHRKVSGIEVDLLTQACSQLGVAFDLHSASNADVQGKVERGEVDVLLCGSEINSDRLRRVDYSDPHTVSAMHVARLSAPMREQSVRRLLGLAFTSRALIFVAAAVFVLAAAAVSVAIMEKTMRSSERNSLRARGASETLNLLQALEWAIGVMLPLQALRMGPFLESGLARGLAVITGIFAHTMILVAYAAAVSTAMMDGRNIAVSSHHSQLEGLRVGVVQGGDAAATRPRDADTLPSLASFATLADLVEALSDGRIDAAVHEGKSLQAKIAAHAAIDNDRLVLTLLSPALPVFIAFEFTRGSKFRAPINRALSVIRQAGQLRQQQALDYPTARPLKALAPGVWTPAAVTLAVLTGGLVLGSAWLRRPRSSAAADHAENRDMVAHLGSDIDSEVLELVHGPLDAGESVATQPAEADSWRLVLAELRAEKGLMAKALGRIANDPVPASRTPPRLVLCLHAGEIKRLTRCNHRSGTTLRMDLRV